MRKCKPCRGRGEIETSPACYETCKECGGSGQEEKPECKKCGHVMFFDPIGIQGWICTHCEMYGDKDLPGSERRKVADRVKREAGEDS